ncbi:hypothetical protein [uncultured Sneathiella sp.]|uniref:hypothetical protein n=1 Tax=uncultured Sneathiella sp. TaxID=879315 RepID=UPI0030DC583B
MPSRSGSAQNAGGVQAVESILQMKTEPFWWDAARPEPTDVTLPETPSDVLIIGGGYTGLSAALTLAKRTISGRSSSRAILNCSLSFIQASMTMPS